MNRRFFLKADTLIAVSAPLHVMARFVPDEGEIVEISGSGDYDGVFKVTKSNQKSFEYEICPHYECQLKFPVIPMPLKHGPDRQKRKSKLKNDWDR